MINRDKFNSVGLDRTAQASMKIIDRIQTERPEVQVVAAAAVFVMLAEAAGLSVQEIMTVTKNVMNDGDRRLRPEFRAVNRYIQAELAR